MHHLQIIFSMVLHVVISSAAVRAWCSCQVQSPVMDRLSCGNGVLNFCWIKGLASLDLYRNDTGHILNLVIRCVMIVIYLFGNLLLSHMIQNMLVLFL